MHMLIFQKSQNNISTTYMKGINWNNMVTACYCCYNYNKNSSFTTTKIKITVIVTGT